MTGCGLGKHHMSHLCDGLAKNTTLTQLLLGENLFSDPACVKSLSDALSQHKNHALTEIDLQKCALVSDCIKPLVNLIQAKYRLRALNLANNGIEDEGAQALLAALQMNPYIIRFKMDLNPIRHSLIKQIEEIAQ